jgi:hypothetical protein
VLEAVTGKDCTYEHACMVCPDEGPQDDWRVIEEWTTYRDGEGRYLLGEFSIRNESTFHHRDGTPPATLEESVTLGTLEAGLGKLASARRAGARSREQSIVAVDRAESTLYLLHISYGQLGLEYWNFDDGVRLEGGGIATFDLLGASPNRPSSEPITPKIANAAIVVNGDACSVKLEYAPSEHNKNKGLEKVIPLTQAQRPLTQAELAKRRLRYEKKGHGGSLILHFSDWKDDGQRYSYELREIVTDESGKPECAFSSTCRSGQGKNRTTLEESFRTIERSLETGDFLVKDSEGFLVCPNEKGGVTLQRYRKGQGLAKTLATYWWVDGRLVSVEGDGLRDPRTVPRVDIVKARFQPLESGKPMLVCETKNGATADTIVEPE